MQPFIQPISVDWDKEIAFFLKAFHKVEPRFDPKLTDKDILNSLFAWVWKLDEYNKLKLDYNKGFCFYGDLGLGKSMILQALRQYRNSIVARHESKKEDFRMKGIWLKAASELANIFSVDGQPALIQYTSDDINLIIDELGREPRPAKYFGTELNVIQFVLQLRYDHRRDSVTHITTNLKPEDIAQYYGAYIADRCWEMFNFIEFQGASLRSKTY
jgi:DNA replication protein DnaC